VRVDVLTIFPEMFEPVLGASIMRLAREKGLLDVAFHNLRDFTDDKRRSVDDRPYGGGPGMILKADPIFRAVDEARAIEGLPEGELVLLSPQGEPFSQGMASELAEAERLILICGHYEGVDERVRVGLAPREVSIGDYVLTGGELAAMVLIDALVRLVPGVLGCPESKSEESFADGALEYPQYTRPVEYRGMRVPEILLGGDHEKIRQWRSREAEKRTGERRPDLWGGRR